MSQSCQVHAMVFDPSDGIMINLPVNFKQLVEEYNHIYDLYPISDKDV